MSEKHPNNNEKLFLELAYNRFDDLYAEVMSDSFWSQGPAVRFTKISDAFSIYTELLHYPPLEWSIEALRRQRPPMEAEIGSEVFKFVRNVVAHYPFYETWNDVWISKPLANWHTPSLSIDRFLSHYEGRDPVKYRFWEPQKKCMTYLSINFPAEYGDKRIYLKDMIDEKDGVRFCFILMKGVLNSQLLSTE